MTDARQIIVSDTPFSAGEEVEVVVSRPGNGSRAKRDRELRSLFKTTQSLPQVRSLTDEDIAREVIAHRRGE